MAALAEQARRPALVAVVPVGLLVRVVPVATALQVVAVAAAMAAVRLAVPAVRPQVEMVEITTAGQVEARVAPALETPEPMGQMVVVVVVLAAAVLLTAGLEETVQNGTLPMALAAVVVLKPDLERPMGLVDFMGLVRVGDVPHWARTA